MTENNMEFGQFPESDEFSGGSVYGETSDGEGMVFLTRQGEFVCYLMDENEMVAAFPSCGLICVYEERGKLTTATLVVGNYLANLIRSGVSLKFPAGGKDISQMEGKINETKMTVMLVAKVKERRVEMVMISPKGQVIWQKSQPFNAESSFNGTLMLDDVDVSLPFIIEATGDELVLGMGEMDGKESAFGMLVVSNQVNFVDSFMTGNSLDVQKLSGKILLN